MLSRLFTRTTNLRLLTLISSNKSHSSPLLPPLSNPNFNFTPKTSRFFSSNRNGRDDPTQPPPSWKLDNDEQVDPFLGEVSGDLTGFGDEEVQSFNRNNKSVRSPVSGLEDGNVDSWANVNESSSTSSSDIFANIEEFDGKKSGVRGGGDDWATADGYKQWSLGEGDKSDVFDICGEGIEGHTGTAVEDAEREIKEAELKLQQQKEELTVQLKGPNRAFGDLIAASGITDVMLDSLILLKDLDKVEGLPPLSEIEQIRYDKNVMKNTRADIERQKQEEIAKSRVRKVDEKGRAYGTGRRKCSVARVFIQPGEGKFLINDKQFDVYFPLLDHRANMLRPFTETKTLGLWDVACTVKGGGVSGQVGAIRLGISRALQNWEPGLRPNLRAAGFLTRDPRMVERKKPGKAKARKSYQWVKR